MKASRCRVSWHVERERDRHDANNTISMHTATIDSVAQNIAVYRFGQGYWELVDRSTGEIVDQYAGVGIHGYRQARVKCLDYIASLMLEVDPLAMV